MDYLAFTELRTRFLQYFYSEASKPFLETKRKIEAYEEPFAHPPWSEDAEPPFLTEWMDAGDALDLLGQSVVSLLAETLHLYLKHWADELRRRAGEKQLADSGVGLPSDPAYKHIFKKKGWLAGYKKYCENLEIDWSDSRVDLDLLEQLVLARNSVQHPDDITSVRARQSESDVDRYPRGFFADELDLRLNESRQPGSRFLRPPRLDMSIERLSLAFEEVDKFCAWLDTKHPLRHPSTGG